MTDGPHDRRQHDGDPVTLGELARRMDWHERNSERLHRDQLRMIEKLDERITHVDDRTDVLATRITVVFSVVAALWAIFLVIAPLLRALIGVPAGG